LLKRLQKEQEDEAVGRDSSLATRLASLRHEYSTDKEDQTPENPSLSKRPSPEAMRLASEAGRGHASAADGSITSSVRSSILSRAGGWRAGMGSGPDAFYSKLQDDPDVARVVSGFYGIGVGGGSHNEER